MHALQNFWPVGETQPFRKGFGQPSRPRAVCSGHRHLHRAGTSTTSLQRRLLAAAQTHDSDSSSQPGSLFEAC